MSGLPSRRTPTITLPIQRPSDRLKIVPSRSARFFAMSVLLFPDQLTRCHLERGGQLADGRWARVAALFGVDDGHLGDARLLGKLALGERLSVTMAAQILEHWHDSYCSTTIAGLDSVHKF